MGQFHFFTSCGGGDMFPVSPPPPGSVAIFRLTAGEIYIRGLQAELVLAGRRVALWRRFASVKHYVAWCLSAINYYRFDPDANS